MGNQVCDEDVECAYDDLVKDHQSYSSFIPSWEFYKSEISNEYADMNIIREMKEWCEQSVSLSYDWIDIPVDCMQVSGDGGFHNEWRFTAYVSIECMKFATENDFIMFRMRWL